MPIPKARRAATISGPRTRSTTALGPRRRFLRRNLRCHRRGQFRGPQHPQPARQPGAARPRRRSPSDGAAPPAPGHPQQPRPAGLRRQDPRRLERPGHRRSRRGRPAARPPALDRCRHPGLQASVLERLWDGNRLRQSWRAGQGRHIATADGYANLIDSQPRSIRGDRRCRPSRHGEPAGRCALRPSLERGARRLLLRLG